MTSTVLRILDLFKPVFLLQHVDYGQLRAIVGIKLEMDNRRVSGFRNQQAQSSNASFAWTVTIYMIFGGFLSLVLAFMPSIVFVYTIYHAYLMVMVTMTLISDFSSVLLDTSDNTIVLPRPISNKTFYAARATHILIYIGMISLALTLVPLVVTFFIYGPLIGLVAIGTTALTVIFSVAFTNGLYLFLMRFTSEERLKNLINYFQIGMAILMMGGYQILPRLFNSKMLENMSADLPWWSLFVPPMWMASTLQIAHSGSATWVNIASVILAVVIPISLWKGINQYLTPYFTQKIADLGTASSNQSPAKEQARVGSVNARGASIAIAGLQRAAFNLISLGFARDRKLKLRMYPAFGYFIVLVFVFIFRDKASDTTWAEYVQKIADSKLHLTAIYACIYVIITASYEIHFTDDYKAAWVFQSAPIQYPGELLIGMLKSIFVRFFLPMYGMATFLILTIWHSKAIVDVVFGFFACVLLMLAIGIIGDKHLPLSVPINVRAQGSSMARAIVSLLIIAAIGIGHYFSIEFEIVLWLSCPVMILFSWLLLKRYQKLNWDDVGL